MLTIVAYCLATANAKTTNALFSLLLFAVATALFLVFYWDDLIWSFESDSSFRYVSMFWSLICFVGFALIALRVLLLIAFGLLGKRRLNDTQRNVLYTKALFRRKDELRRARNDDDDDDRDAVRRSRVNIDDDDNDDNDKVEENNNNNNDNDNDDKSARLSFCGYVSEWARETFGAVASIAVQRATKAKHKIQLLPSINDIPDRLVAALLISNVVALVFAVMIVVYAVELALVFDDLKTLHNAMTTLRHFVLTGIIVGGIVAWLGLMRGSIGMVRSFARMRSEARRGRLYENNSKGLLNCEFYDSFLCENV
jgi:hypothetical protein